MNFKEKVFFKVKNKIEKKEGFFPFLYFLSFFYRFFIFFKNSLYDFKILKPKKADIFVVSIGNIVAGGAGKTPFCIFLANKLKKIAIISRGYKSKREKKNTILNREILYKKKYLAKDIGDEPFLLVNRTNCYVLVGRDKVKSTFLAKDLNLSVAIVDDGFQTRKLKRDLDILVLNCKNLFSNEKFLPRGLLRDSKKRLKKADFIVLSNFYDGFNLREIKKYTSKIIGTSSFILNFENLEGKEFLKLEKEIAIFSSIANPNIFKDSLKNLGYKVIDNLFLLDHSFFSKKLLKDFSKKAKEIGAKALVCSYKDAVKIDKNIKLDLPIFFTKQDLKIVYGEKNFQNLLNLIENKSIKI